MSGSGEKEEVKLLWEEAVEAFGRSLPAGRHLVSRGGNTVQQAAQGRWTHGQLGLAGSTSSPVTGGEACSAGSEMKAVTRQG